MKKKEPEKLEDILHERSARYVVDAENRPIAVLLTLEEYEHYLDLLDDEADSQDETLAASLEEAATRTHLERRESFDAYLGRRKASKHG